MATLASGGHVPQTDPPSDSVPAWIETGYVIPAKVIRDHAAAMRAVLAADRED